MLDASSVTVLEKADFCPAWKAPTGLQHLCHIKTKAVKQRTVSHCHSVVPQKQNPHRTPWTDLHTEVPYLHAWFRVFGSSLWWNLLNDSGQGANRQREALQDRWGQGGLKNSWDKSSVFQRPQVSPSTSIPWRNRQVHAQACHLPTYGLLATQPMQRLQQCSALDAQVLQSVQTPKRLWTIATYIPAESRTLVF